jgi:hypothetical protein
MRYFFVRIECNDVIDINELVDESEMFLVAENLHTINFLGRQPEHTHYFSIHTEDDIQILVDSADTLPTDAIIDLAVETVSGFLS